MDFETLVNPTPDGMVTPEKKRDPRCFHGRLFETQRPTEKKLKSRDIEVHFYFCRLREGTFLYNAIRGIGPHPPLYCRKARRTERQRKTPTENGRGQGTVYCDDQRLVRPHAAISMAVRGTGCCDPSVLVAIQ